MELVKEYLDTHTSNSFKVSPNDNEAILIIDGQIRSLLFKNLRWFVKREEAPTYTMGSSLPRHFFAGSRNIEVDVDCIIGSEGDYSFLSRSLGKTFVLTTSHMKFEGYIVKIDYDLNDFNQVVASVQFLANKAINIENE